MHTMFIRFAVALLLSACTVNSFAQALPATAPAPRVAFPVSTVGNISTVGVATADAANAAKFSFGVAANGAVFANAGASLPTPGGSSIPLTVAGSVPKAAVGAALAKFITKGLPLLNTGVALYDLAKELGFNASNENNAPLTFGKVTEGDSCASNCFTYQEQAGFNWPAGGFVQSPSAAANYVVGHQLCASHCGTVQSVVVTGSPGAYTGRFTIYINDYWGTEYVNLGIYSKAAEPYSNSTSTPSTQQEFIDAVAAKSGWPSSSALARTLVDAIKSGEQVAVEPSAVTGPATSPGPVTTSRTANDPATNPSTNPASNPNTTTQVQTVTNNYSYQGAKVTTTQTTSNVTTNNQTGVVTKSSDTTADPEAEPVDYSFSDSPLGAVPKLYTPVYPRGLQGVWDDQKAAMAGTSLARLIPSLMPSVANSGQCPTMPINLNITSWANFGTVDVAPPCFLWDFGKVVIIMSALLLARGLVFGG